MAKIRTSHCRSAALSAFELPRVLPFLRLLLSWEETLALFPEKSVSTGLKSRPALTDTLSIPASTKRPVPKNSCAIPALTAERSVVSASSAPSIAPILRSRYVRNSLNLHMSVTAAKTALTARCASTSISRTRQKSRIGRLSRPPGVAFPSLQKNWNVSIASFHLW